MKMQGCSSKFVKYILFVFNLIFARENKQLSHSVICIITIVVTLPLLTHTCLLILTSVSCIFLWLNYHRKRVAKGFGQLSLSLISIMISGIGLIVAGSIVLADVGEYSHFMEGRIIAPPIVLIVAGVIVFIVAFLGCYGAIRENYYMLIAFAVLLLIVFIVELAVGIAAAVYKNDFQSVLKDSLRSSMDKYHEVKTDKMAWDHVQTKLECCGVDGPQDWPEKKRPYTCCHEVRENADPPEDFHCQSAAAGDDILYSVGCYEMLEMKANKNAKILIGVGIGIAFVEIIGIILACWLAAAIRKKD